MIISAKHNKQDLKIAPNYFFEKFDLYSRSNKNIKHNCKQNNVHYNDTIL